jgi:hypothetical protein
VPSAAAPAAGPGGGEASSAPSSIDEALRESDAVNSVLVEALAAAQRRRELLEGGRPTAGAVAGRH